MTTINTGTLDGLVKPGVIFIFSFVPSLSPSILLASKKLRSMYNRASIVSAGLLLAILFIDFMPHLVEGPHSHSHSHSPSHSHSLFTLARFMEKLKETHLGLIIAGLTLIGLIIIDQRVIKHSHCDKEKEAGVIETESEKKETLHSHSHSHGSCETHVDLEEKKHSSAVESIEQEEIKGCCTEGLKYKTTVKQALIFIFIFSIHSIFEGFAFTPQKTGGFTLFIGLLVHKILESITVGIALFSSQFTKPVSVSLLFLYSALTPLGMISAYYISGVFDSWVLKEIFTGMAFGSLSFIVLVEMLPPIVHSLTNPMKIFYLLSGYIIGAIFITLAHTH